MKKSLSKFSDLDVSRYLSDRFFSSKNSSDSQPSFFENYFYKKRIIASPSSVTVSLLAFVKVSPGSWTAVWNRSHHIWLCSWNSSNRPTLTRVCACVCVFLRSPRSSRVPLLFLRNLSLSLFLFSINSQIDCMEIIRRTRYRRLQGFFLQVEGKLGPLTPRERDYATWMQCDREKQHRVWNCDKSLQILVGSHIYGNSGKETFPRCCSSLSVFPLPNFER